jgi:hypothetical protein
MGKYDPLKRFLAASGAKEVPLTFAEIEQILGTSLPESRQYPAWWSNNPSNNTMTRVWLAAGYRTERVDIAGQRVVFRRAGGAAAARREEPSQSRRVADVVARLQDRLAGTVRLAPGVDLTEPTGEVWDAETK